MEHQTLIIGLGNPDPILEETYHNVGALGVRQLAARFAMEQPSPDKEPRFRTYKDSFAYATVGERTFIQPLFYMNESGQAVKEALHVFKAKSGDITVIHDDSDLLLGTFKRAMRGRSAGHRGIQSIIDHLKTEDFARIRIGIREKNEVHRKKAGSFVLSPITPADKKILDDVFAKIFLLLNTP